MALIRSLESYERDEDFDNGAAVAGDEGPPLCWGIVHDERSSQSLVRSDGSDAAALSAVQTRRAGAQAPAAGPAGGRQVRIPVPPVRRSVRHQARTRGPET